MGYMCVGCNFPISHAFKEEVVSIFVRNGKREMETLRVGILEEYDLITPSEGTLKYSSVEQLNKATELLKADVEKERLRERKYYLISDCSGLSNEEAAKTGFSVWHLGCALKELNVTRYVEIEKDKVRTMIKVLEENLRISDETDMKELLEKSLENEKNKLDKLESMEFDIFDNPFLKDKFRSYNKWNQNIISRSGGFYGDTFFETMRQTVVQFWDLGKSQDFGVPYHGNQMCWSESDWHLGTSVGDYGLADMIMFLGIPKQVLLDALAKYEEN